MASVGGSQVLSPPPCSSAFLLKCAKEKEKLRVKLRKKLQGDLLSIFQEGIFPDLSISSLEGQKISAHSGLLKIRVPTFHQQLLNDSVNNPPAQAQTAVETAELVAFLKKVYTDDDIRKHECDILRRRKAAAEPESCNVDRSDSLENTSLQDSNYSQELVSSVLDSLQRDPTGSGADDSVISGASSSLNTKLPSEENTMKQQQPNNTMSESSSSTTDSTPNCSSLINEVHTKSHVIEKPIPKRLDIVANHCLEHIPTPGSDHLETPEKENVKELSLPSDGKIESIDEIAVLVSPSASDAEFQTDEATSPTSSNSLVRSSTFDLQGPLALEKMLDSQESLESQSFESMHISQDYREIMMNTTREIQQSMSVDQPHSSKSFYLHQQQQQQYQQQQQLREDGSMSDSGFLSQSLFSENDLSSSIASSLMTSFDAGQLVSPGFSREPEPCKEDQSPKQASPMFPMYIDMQAWASSNPGALPGSAAKGIDPNGNVSTATETHCDKMEPTPVTSQKTMDLIAELPPDCPLRTTPLKRPQSCYMFIDFDKVEREERQSMSEMKSRTTRDRGHTQRLPSLSMFIDFNQEVHDSVMTAQEQYKTFQTDSQDVVKEPKEGIPDLVENRMDQSNRIMDQAEIKPELESIKHDDKNGIIKMPEDVRHSPRKTKDMVKSGIDEEGLLPMSPIMRRKTVKTEVIRPVSEPCVQIKASTKPQDIDAMTFRRSLTDAEESPIDIIKVPSSKIEPEQIQAIEIMEETIPKACEIKLEEAIENGEPVKPLELPPIEVPQQTVSVEKSRPRMQQMLSFENEDDSETVYSEVSDVSSSVLGGFMKPPRDNSQSPEGDDGSIGSNTVRALEACSKLGEDLLHMFLEEICWDVTIQVTDKTIKAHRCILVSRCSYFAAMLNGEWSESSGNLINLQGFNYPVVHFALCHLYSGALNLPKDIAIPELAMLADMLALDSLKEVIVFYLKMNYCHFFHKPCNQCSVGVVECLPIAVSCNLSELQGKVVRWVGKHFTRIWATKAFAGLQDDFREQCYQQTLLNMSVETVIDMTLSCDRLMATLPHLKWAEPVFGLVTRLLEDCIHFMASKFDQVLSSDGFMALGKSQSWNVAALEDSVLSSVELVNPDSACRTFVQLGRLIPMTQSQCARDMGDWTQNFLDLLHRIQRHCERYLIHNANRVVHCQSWALLAPEVQKKIKDAAVIVFEFEKPTAPPPRLSSLQRKPKHSEDKSLTYPRKAQVVRGKKTSKSFRERSVDKTESTEVKRPLSENICIKLTNRSINGSEPDEPKSEPAVSEEKSSSCKDSLELEDKDEELSDRMSRCEDDCDEESETLQSQRQTPVASEEVIYALPNRNRKNRSKSGDKTTELPGQVCKQKNDCKTDHQIVHKKHKSVSHRNPDDEQIDDEVIDDRKHTYIVRGDEKRPAQILAPLPPLPKSPSTGSSSETSPKAPLPPPHSKATAVTPRLSRHDEPLPIPPRSPSGKNMGFKGHNINNLQSPSSIAAAPEKPPRKLNLIPHCSSPTFSNNTRPNSSNNNKTYSVKAENLSPSYEPVWVATKESLSDEEDDLVAEIDEETMLVNNCLQEAEILEQELAKKLLRQSQQTYSAVQRKKDVGRQKPSSEAKATVSVPSALPQQIRKKSEPKEAKPKKPSKSHDPSPSKLKVDSSEVKTRSSGVAVSPRLRSSSAVVKDRSKAAIPATRK